jgi:hypothetical protein
MAKFYRELTDSLVHFIGRQHIFFTASAAGSGRINLSPKGLESFRVLSERRVAYLDLTGSGAETAAHLQADGRLTIMFCSFDGEPMILRLYGRGHVVTPGDDEWPSLGPQFQTIPGERAIVVLDIESLQSSCGFGVPLYRFEGQRDELVHWAERKGKQALAEYRREKNQLSIDGLPTGFL